MTAIFHPGWSFFVSSTKVRHSNFFNPSRSPCPPPWCFTISTPVEVFLGFLGVRLLNFFNPSRSFFFRESVAQKIFNPRRSFFRSSLVFLWPILVYFRSFMVYPLNIIFNPSRSFVCYNKIFNPSRSFLGSTPLSTVFLFLALLEVSWSQLKWLQFFIIFHPGRSLFVSSTKVRHSNFFNPSRSFFFEVHVRRSKFFLLLDNSIQVFSISVHVHSLCSTVFNPRRSFLGCPAGSAEQLFLTPVEVFFFWESAAQKIFTQ